MVSITSFYDYDNETHKYLLKYEDGTVEAIFIPRQEVIMAPSLTLLLNKVLKVTNAKKS